MTLPTHLSRARSRTAVLTNENLVCAADGCGQQRFGFNHLCRQHMPRYRIQGHFAARPVTPKKYKPHVQHVREVLADHPTHPGLVYALNLLKAWMAQATAADGLPRKQQPYPSAIEVCRLAKAGVGPQDILATLVGAMYYQRVNPHCSPDDQARDFMLSHAVFQLSPRSIKSFTFKGKPNRARPHFRALQHCGRYLRTALAPLIVQLHLALDNRGAKQAQAVEAMRLPF